MVSRSIIKTGDVWLVQFDPTVGSEIRKTRPAVIVSPAEMNVALNTLLVAPLTTGGWPAQFRVPTNFDGKDGLILLDQLRVIDRKRLIKKLGNVPKQTLAQTLATLRDIFEE